MNKTYAKPLISIIATGIVFTLATGFVPTTKLTSNLGLASATNASSLATTDYGYPMKYRTVSVTGASSTTAYHADAIAFDAVMWALFSVMAAAAVRLPQKDTKE